MFLFLSLNKDTWDEIKRHVNYPCMTQSRLLSFVLVAHDQPQKNLHPWPKALCSTELSLGGKKGIESLDNELPGMGTTTGWKGMSFDSNATLFESYMPDLPSDISTVEPTALT